MVILFPKFFLNKIGEIKQLLKITFHKIMCPDVMLGRTRFGN